VSSLALLDHHHQQQQQQKQQRYRATVELYNDKAMRNEHSVLRSWQLATDYTRPFYAFFLLCSLVGDWKYRTGKRRTGNQITTSAWSNISDKPTMTLLLLNDVSLMEMRILT